MTINRNMNNIPVVSAVASLDPSALSEDQEQKDLWLSDARTWEDVYSVRTYDYLEIIVRGGIPVWDKDEKRFVDKAALSTENADSKLEEELTMGVENIKANLQVAETVETTAASTDEEEDDLPF